ncbi:uncharacterized protein PS065_020034 [Dugong dugon]
MRGCLGSEQSAASLRAPDGRRRRRPPAQDLQGKKKPSKFFLLGGQKEEGKAMKPEASHCDAALGRKSPPQEPPPPGKGGEHLFVPGASQHAGALLQSHELCLPLARRGASPRRPNTTPRADCGVKMAKWSLSSKAAEEFQCQRGVWLKRFVCEERREDKDTLETSDSSKGPVRHPDVELLRLPLGM